MIYFHSGSFMRACMKFTYERLMPMHIGDPAVERLLRTVITGQDKGKGLSSRVAAISEHDGHDERLHHCVNSCDLQGRKRR